MFRREPGKISGRLSHEFTVPDILGGRSDQPLELGTLPLD